MHGLIFAELRRYTNRALGAGSWAKLLETAGLSNKLYMPLGAYPDEELIALVSAAASLTDQTDDETLEGFGEFIAPGLIDKYRALIPQHWKTLDIVENTEETIHRVVRVRDQGADPPRLQCHRRSDKVVVVTYSSPRRLCALAKGIVRGIAVELNDEVTISESSCMHNGAPACEIVVTLEASSSTPA